MYLDNLINAVLYQLLYYIYLENLCLIEFFKCFVLLLHGKEHFTSLYTPDLDQDIVLFCFKSKFLHFTIYHFPLFQCGSNCYLSLCYLFCFYDLCSVSLCNIYIMLSAKSNLNYKMRYMNIVNNNNNNNNNTVEKNTNYVFQRFVC